MKPYQFPVLLGLFLLTSCGPKVVFEETKTFEQEVWAYDDIARFDFQVEDTFAYYDVWVAISHNANYPYQNMYTNILTAYPNQADAKQLLSFEMANKGGQWYGKCSDEICQLYIPLQERVQFTVPGDYQLGFEQYNRKDSLWGIQSFTLKIQESKE